MPAEALAVEVVYALPDRQTVLQVVLPEGATIGQAIAASGMLARHPTVDLETCRVGIFGHLRNLADVVRDGDRVEIYRPLVVDPKERRRRRAQGD